MPDLNNKKSAEELMADKQTIFAKLLIHFRTKYTENIYQVFYKNECFFVNNDIHKQLILAQSKKILMQFIDEVNLELKQFGLTLYIGNVFEMSDFWDFIEQNGDNILMLKFIIPYPNLCIDNVVNGTLKQAKSKSTTIKFEADNDSSLTIDKNNELLNELVEYSVQRSLKISVKVKGERDKYFYIGDKIKEICAENYNSIIEILTSK